MTKRDNLIKLANYLDTVPQSAFDMTYYQSDCGTVGCAAGHGPAAGIEKNPDENWYSYSRRCFVGYAPRWKWCFDSSWSDTDNTSSGAAARIRWMLEYGVPDNWRGQMYGRSPLSYKGGEA